MNYRIFQYPLPAAEELTDLNGYLSSHKVASVRQEMVTMPGGAPMLVFVVETAIPTGGLTAGKGRKGTIPDRPMVDYREKLPATEFAVFSDLRILRVKLATEAGGVPPFSIFNNEQLAAMVTGRMRTVAEVAAIPGVSEGKAAKHAEEFLAIIREAFPEPAGSTGGLPA